MNATTSLDSELRGTIEPRPLREVRPFFWSIRRELWENRFLYMAPFIVTAVVLFASVMNTMINLPKNARNLAALEPSRQHTAMVQTVMMAPAPIMLATLLVGLFYAFDALYSERRDRSILFWKSLPVSDRTTVLSKAAIPLVVLPLLALVLSLFAQSTLLLAGTAILLVNGLNPGLMLREFNFIAEPVIMVYGLSAHILWFSPIYAWFILVSAWARRTPFLWGVLPFVLIGIVEQIAFRTQNLARFIGYRFSGAMSSAFDTKVMRGDDVAGVGQFAQITPVRFLLTPGLWLGLAVAAAAIAAAIRLRHSREPL